MRDPIRVFASALVVAVTAIASIHVLRGVSNRAPLVEALESRASVAPDSEIHLVSDASSPPPAAPVASPRTRRDYLREYWGARWPAIEADLRERGKDLDFIQGELPPAWAEVAELARTEVFHLPADERAGIKQGMLLDVQPVTAEFLMSRFGLDAREVSGLNLREGAIRVEAQDARLEELTERYVDALDAALDKSFENGWFSRGPFHSVSEGIRPGRGIYSKGGGFKGWALGIVVTAEDFPELEETDREVASLRRERFATLAAWVEENKPR